MLKNEDWTKLNPTLSLLDQDRRRAALERGQRALVPLDRRDRRVARVDARLDRQEWRAARSRPGREGPARFATRRSCGSSPRSPGWPWWSGSSDIRPGAALGRGRRAAQRFAIISRRATSIRKSRPWRAFSGACLRCASTGLTGRSSGCAEPPSSSQTITGINIFLAYLEDQAGSHGRGSQPLHRRARAAAAIAVGAIQPGPDLSVERPVGLRARRHEDRSRDALRPARGGEGSSRDGISLPRAGRLCPRTPRV